MKPPVRVVNADFRLNGRMPPVRIHVHNIHRAAIDFMAERRRVRTFEWSTAIIAAVSIVAGTIVYVREGSEKFTAILTSDLWLFGGMLPKMAAGCLIAAFVTRLLPREVVARVVGGESGVLGILIAMMMGAVLP